MPASRRIATRISIVFALLLPAGGCSGAQSASSAAPREIIGFTAYWDSLSTASLARNRHSLDAAVTTWIALDSVTGVPRVLYADTVGRTERTPRRMAILTSWLGDRFHPRSVRRLAADRGQLSRAAGVVAQSLRDGRHSGLVLDLEALAPADLPALVAVVRTLADTLRTGGLGPLIVAIPATDTIAYPARPIIEAGASFVLPMLYDLHWSGGTPGPVVEAGWAKLALESRVREVGTDRVIAGLPLYGYRWPGEGAGATVTYDEAVRASTAAGVRIERDTASGAMRSRLPAGAQIWLTDAEQIARLVEVCETAGVRRIALWYVGQEDPALWAVLRRR